MEPCPGLLEIIILDLFDVEALFLGAAARPDPDRTLTNWTWRSFNVAYLIELGRTFENGLSSEEMFLVL